MSAYSKYKDNLDGIIYKNFEINDEVIYNEDNINKVSGLTDLVTKENQFLNKLNEYERVSKEYDTMLKNFNNSKNSINDMNDKLNNLTSINNELTILKTQILDIKDNKMAGIRGSLLNKSNTRDTFIKNKMNELKTEQENIKKIRDKLNEANGLNNYYIRDIKHNNYKYLALLLMTIFLIISIIFSIAVPYQTNMEMILFILLCIIVIYYIYLYVKNYKYDLEHNMQNSFKKSVNFFKFG